ncbi:MAG: hypothetical protein J1F31_03325 [Erysipelotrichales bacterium]|nr:hypothetical protein [Erysipelotrichales bacterium]
MKTKFRNISLISILAIYLVANLFIFLFTSAEYRTTVFWIAWAFTFGVNLCVLAFIYFFTKKSDRNDIVTIPGLLYVFYSANALYAGLGTYFMGFKHTSLATVKVAWAVYVALSVIYLIVVAYMTWSVGYIRQNKQHTRKKVFYIEDLRSSVEVLIPFINDKDLKTKMTKLADDIRFSDPMSDESLLDCETNLKLTVDEIVACVDNNDFEKLDELIEKAEKQLKFRNAKCKILR